MYGLSCYFLVHWKIFVLVLIINSLLFSEAQWLEHCVSSAKVVGSIPWEHMY